MNQELCEKMEDIIRQLGREGYECEKDSQKVLYTVKLTENLSLLFGDVYSCCSVGLYLCGELENLTIHYEDWQTRFMGPGFSFLAVDVQQDDSLNLEIEFLEENEQRTFGGFTLAENSGQYFVEAYHDSPHLLEVELYKYITNEEILKYFSTNPFVKTKCDPVYFRVMFVDLPIEVI